MSRFRTMLKSKKLVLSRGGYEQIKEHNRIKSLADIYISMHELDFEKNRITELKALPYVSSILAGLSGPIQEQLNQIMRMLTVEEDLDRVLLFVDFKTLDKRLAGSNTITQEFRGPHGWARGRIIVVERAADGEIIKALWMVESIREEKEREELLKRQSEAKGQFLANMSHEIRTPINAILGLDTMILRESKESQIREYAVDIHNAGHTLLALIGDILDMSKIEAGKLEIIPVEYDFASLIHDVISMTSVRAHEKKLEFNLRMDDGLPMGLVGDDVRIRQILVNIINNAVKYTEHGGVTLDINGKKCGDEISLRFSVKDTGIGIKKEDIDRLFKEYERIEEVRNHGVEGTGLGMSITMKLLSLMDSGLEVDSVYGEGSDFSFEIKQKIWNDEKIGNLAQRYVKNGHGYEYRASFSAPDANILVVDDNRMNIRIFKNLIKDLQMNVDDADGGIDALGKIQKNKYDIIFMDHMMPDMDGVQVMREISTWEDYPNKKTPIVILTANAIAGAKEDYLAEGFDDYLSKPINPDKLERMIFDMLPEDKRQEAVQERAGEEIEEEMPEVEGIDWEYAKIKLKDISFARDVVKDFSLTAELEIQKLVDLYRDIDKGKDMDEAFRQYRVKVHSMKSTTAMFGAMEVSALARILEDAAGEKNLEQISGLMDIFEKRWIRLKKRIDEAFGFTKEDSTGNVQPDIDTDMLIQYLDMLQNAMAELDIDTADAIANELQNYKHNVFSQNYIDEIYLAVRNLDQDKIKDLITAWKGEI